MKNKIKLKHFVITSLSMVLIYTAVVTILTAVTGQDYGTYYTVFCGIFGGTEIISCAIIKVFGKEKKEEEWQE